MKNFVILLLVLTSLFVLSACEEKTPAREDLDVSGPVTGLLLRIFDDELLFYIPSVKGAPVFGPLTVVAQEGVALPEDATIGETYFIDIERIDKAAPPIAYAREFQKQEGDDAINPYVVMNINEGVDLSRIAGGRLIDVRTPEEYEAGHIDGAELMPLQELASFVPEFLSDTDRPLFLYCRSGNRSNQALQLLKKEGLPLIFDIGGFNNFDPQATEVAASNFTTLKALVLNVHPDEASLDLWVPDTDGESFAGPLVLDMKEGHVFSEEIHPGDTVLVTYNEMMTRSYPGQILANGVSVVEGDKQTFGSYVKVDMAMGKDLAVMFNLPLLDLRDKATYDEGHLPDAIACPKDDLKASLQGLDPQKPVLVYSGEDGISKKLQQQLLDAGVPLILDLGNIADYDGDLEH